MGRRTGRRHPDPERELRLAQQEAGLKEVRQLAAKILVMIADLEERLEAEYLEDEEEEE